MENSCLIILTEKFKKGDMTAFPVIFAEFSKLINFYASKSADDDVSQELSVFLIEILYKINTDVFKKDDGDSMQRYIAVCIRNKYIALSKSKDKIKNESAVFNDLYFEEQPSFIDRYALREAVSRLSKSQKNIIIYKYIYNYSDVEIAGFLGISRQAVNRLKNRATENLRKYYLQEG